IKEAVRRVKASHYFPAIPQFRAPDLQDGFLAVAQGAIPAQSGTTAGVGTVYAVSWTATYDGTGAFTSVMLTTGTIPVSVYNPSSTTMSSGNGIDSGQYCWVQGGLVVPIEC